MGTPGCPYLRDVHIFMTPGPQNYIDSGTPSPNLHRYGDPHPHIYGRYGDLFVGLGTPTYVNGTELRTPVPKNNGDPHPHIYGRYGDS